MTETTQENVFTVTSDDGEVIVSVDVETGEGIVKNGYKIVGYERKEFEAKASEVRNKITEVEQRMEERRKRFDRLNGRR